MEISHGERRGAEIDYLKRCGKEWLSIKTEEERNNFKFLHPCYQRLVDSELFFLKKINLAKILLKVDFSGTFC